MTEVLDKVEEAAPLSVLVQQNPFEVGHQLLEVPRGLTIQQIVERAGVKPFHQRFVRVWVNDREVPRELWKTVKVKAGNTLYVRVTPQNGKNPFAVILSVIVVVVAVVAQQYYAVGAGSALFGGAGTLGAGIAGAVAAAAVSLVGNMAIAALFGPPKQDTGSTTSNQRYQITGTSNQMNPYGYIPRVIGSRRIYPVMAAHPYTENIGNDQYVRMLLLVGYGPLQITDICIGDTPLSAFTGVQIETREGWPSDAPTTLYTTDINEVDFQIELDRSANNDADWISRTTDTNTSEIVVDVACLRGLQHFNDDGSGSALSVSCDVQYRLAGTSNWLTPAWVNGADDGLGTNGQITPTDSSTSAVVRSGHFITGQPGQWEVRLRRTTPTRDTHNIDTLYWTALKSVAYQAPITQKGLALIAVRIKATNQLNGVPNSINCIATSYLQPWTPAGGWGNWAPSSNPALGYLHLLRYRGLDDPQIPESRIDLPGISAWAADCDQRAINANEPRWSVNITIEGGSIFDALQTVASHARAKFSMKDGKYSIFRDILQTVPVQHITPRNSSNYSGVKAFADLPHALRISFYNEQKNYAQDELVVYMDGYDITNATKFESLDFPAITSPTNIWREGRYYLAAAYLRPEVHTVTMDIENLRCTLGDLVRFAHDVISVGLNQGRILRPVFGTDGSITALKLDGTVQMDAGRSYGIRVRTADGNSNVYSVVTNTGLTDTLVLNNPITGGGSVVPPDTDDLYMYGEISRESAPMLVKSINPGDNLSAEIQLVDAQSGVWSADQLPIPAFDSYVTTQTPLQQQAPIAPVISTVRSDESVIVRLSDGSLQDRICITISPAASSFVPPSGYEAQYRVQGGNQWLSAPDATVGDPNIYISPVIEKGTYDIRVRSVSKYGIASDWVPINGYTVIGKTSPPHDVTSFASVATALGAQLTWDQAPDIDLSGYTLKEGANWSEGTPLSENFSGTSFFLQFTDSDSVSLMIKAVDVLGNESLNAAVLTTQAVAPDDVQSYSVYAQNDSFLHRWQKIADTGYEYEIREGSSWELGRVVGRFAGDTATVKWPVSDETNVIFWIKALSPAGLYSVNARYATILAQPLPNRNLVFERDFSEEGWPGTKIDLAIDGSFLDLVRASNVNQTSGDYYEEIALPATYYARNWIQMRANSVAGSGLTWDEADFTWDAPDGPTWQGVLGDAEGAQLTAYIAPAITLDAGVVEGWRLNGSLAGANGTAATEQVGVSYAPGWVGNGVDVKDTCRVAWAVSVPAAFSLTFDFRADQVLSDDYALFTLSGSGASLVFFHDRLTGTFALVDGQGNRLEIALPVELGDNLVFAVSQSNTTRALYGATRRYPTPQSAQADIEPAGTFSKLALHA